MKHGKRDANHQEIKDALKAANGIYPNRPNNPIRSDD